MDETASPSDEIRPAIQVDSCGRHPVNDVSALDALIHQLRKYLFIDILVWEVDRQLF